MCSSRLRGRNTSQEYAGVGDAHILTMRPLALALTLLTLVLALPGCTTVTARFNGPPALIAAINAGDTQKLDSLLRAGADPNITYFPDQNAVVAAAVVGRTDMMELLIEHGADVNTRGLNHRSVLSYALSCKHEEVAELLVVHGANVNAGEWAGATPLDFAAQNGMLQAVQFLLAHGADVNGNVSDAGSTKGIARRQRPDRGNSPLASAANTGIADYLVAHGADVGRDPGIIISQSGYGHADVVAFLLDHGVDPNVRSAGGSTPLHNVSNAETAQVLIAHGAKVDARDDFGWTPLARAVQSHRRDVVRYLVSHGADVNAQLPGGRTVLSLASGDIAQLLAAP